jgi:hypothetical protein
VAPSIPAPTIPMTRPGAIIRRRSTPRWCRSRAGRPPRRVRRRSGSTRRHRPAGGVSPETPPQALRGRHPRLKGHPVTVPVRLGLRLRGRRRHPVTGGRVRRESRRLDAAGTALRPRPRATTGAAIPRASDRAVTSAVMPRATECRVTSVVVPETTGRRVTGVEALRATRHGATGVPPPRGRRLGTPGPFPPVRRLAAVGRSPGASQSGVAGGRRLLRVRPVTGVLVPRVKCPGTPGPPPPARSLVTAGLPSRARCLATVGPSLRMRRPAAVGGRLPRTRAPAATGRIPGLPRTVPARTPGAAGTRGADGTTPVRTRGAGGKRLGAIPGGRRMTAVRTLAGQGPTLSGAGAPALRLTSRPGQESSTPTGVAGLPAGARPRPRRAGSARRPRRSRRRATAGGTGLAVRGDRRPARSWKAACCPEPRLGPSGASSTAAATSWSQARTMIPGGTATPQAAVGAGGAVSSAGAAATPTPNLITTSRPGPPVRTHRSARPRLSRARGAAGRLPGGPRRRLAVRSRPAPPFLLAGRSRPVARFHRAGRCRLGVRSYLVVLCRLEHPYRPVDPFRPEVP